MRGGRFSRGKKIEELKKRAVRFKEDKGQREKKTREKNRLIQQGLTRPKKKSQEKKRGEKKKKRTHLVGESNSFWESCRVGDLT